MNNELICVPCADRREQQIPIAVESICQECFTYATTEVLTLARTGGKPEVRERLEPFNSTLRDTALPKELGTIIDLAPVNTRESSWLLLSEGGQISRFDCETLEFVNLARSSLVPEPDQKTFDNRVAKRRLHASNNGEFAAVVNNYGRFGQVIDLRSGEVTLELDGGDYYPNTVPFSFAFADLNTSVIAIHRTAWNRLDLSDPATGKLLTERGPTSYTEGEKRPEHYLDYFHGALYVSPGSTRILDDGWVWAPVGGPVVWSLQSWLSENAWESEDGPSRTELCWRHYYWDNGMTWLDQTRIAIAGIGDDDADMIEGARIFDVTALHKTPGWFAEWDAAEITSFAGPTGLFFSDGVSLFTSGSSGLSRWDFIDGVRTGHLRDFQPTHHHRGSRELVQLKEGVLLRWNTDG